MSDRFELAEDQIPLPATIEAQTAWQMANILRDLPSGAPLGRLAYVYRGLFGRLETNEGYKLRPRVSAGTVHGQLAD